MKDSLYNASERKDLRRILRKQSTPQERMLWSKLRNSQTSYKFRRQYSFGPYVADFVCIEKKLIVEVDGSQHIEEEKYDEERTLFLNKKGYKVLRFWNNEINDNLEGVMMKIKETLNNLPHPNPLLFKEREND